MIEAQSNHTTTNPAGIENAYQAHMKRLYGLPAETNPFERCRLIEELDVLDRLRQFQVIEADPPPNKITLLANEIAHLATLGRRLGKKPTHRQRWGSG